MGRAVSVAMALVAALALAGLSAGAQERAGAQAPAAVKLASAGIASDIGFFLALKKGYFREEGLAVEMTQLANAPQMIGPLGRGQLDVGGGTVAAGLYN